MEIYEKLWQKILGDLQVVYTQDTFDDLFGNLNSIYKYQNNHVYIVVSNEWVRNRINNLHLKKINSIAKNYHSDPIDFIFIIRAGSGTSAKAQEMTIGDFLCCSAFEMDVRDYRCNQRPRTILRKERIHIASQTSYTLYDRLPPIPQEPPPDESSQ